MSVKVEPKNDETITHIKAMKKTRYQLNVLSSIKGDTAQDFLSFLVEKEYKKQIKG